MDDSRACRRADRYHRKGPRGHSLADPADCHSRLLLFPGPVQRGAIAAAIQTFRAYIRNVRLRNLGSKVFQDLLQPRIAVGPHEVGMAPAAAGLDLHGGGLDIAPYRWRGSEIVENRPRCAP